jgi:type II secretory pathway pseudopilin PulG
MDTSGPITILEVLFLIAMLGIALVIAFGSTLYRAIELQNNITTVVEDLTLVQATIDTIQTVNLAQLNFSFDSLRSSVYNNGYNPGVLDPLNINDWALCTSYPFPSGNPPDHQVDPLGILPPWKNSTLQKERCDILYAKTALDLLNNNS